MDRVASRALAATVLGLRPLVDRRITSSRSPLPAGYAMRPHAGSRRWAWTHFGVFVPQLPAPYRYVNTMTLLGSTGTEIFDNDALAAPDARNTSTVFSSTAHADQHHYAAYDEATECTFAEDGSTLRWRDDLELDIRLPSVKVRGRYAAFSVDLDLTVTRQVSFFVDTPIYQHLSLLAPYTGTITDTSGDTRISGLGTFEYARCVGHQSLSRKPVPPRLKLPVDFFTYQILQLDDRTQVLLTKVSARGHTACLLAHLRVLGGETTVFDDVVFDVTYQPEPAVDRWGRPMRLPEKLRWVVREHGRELLTIDGTVDAPMRFGHGRGYAGAYSFTGELRAEPVDGSGYIEWVDVQDGRGSR
ncbi:MAG TPA: DUF6670 family protein [Mycobacterium sp.]|nr:DUF6670 family protein [Mycobacterium sp.]